MCIDVVVGNVQKSKIMCAIRFIVGNETTTIFTTKQQTETLKIQHILILDMPEFPIIDKDQNHEHV